MKRGVRNVLAAGVLAIFCGAPPAKAAEVFTLTSSAFPTTASWQSKMRAATSSDAELRRARRSPPLAWHNPPEGTKSMPF